MRGNTYPPGTAQARAHRAISGWFVRRARGFVAHIDGDRLDPHYSVALAVGLRKGEALGLRWDDVDLPERQVMQNIGHSDIRMTRR
jgi:integrase